MQKRRLDAIFDPRTVAVIGATNRKGSVGYAVISNIIGSDYGGVVYPVNPKRNSILGVRCYPSVLATPDKVDLAVIATPAHTVPDIIDECGRAGVRGIVILSAGFKEAGRDGDKMCKKIVGLARQYDMRIIGPNCLGFIKPSIGLNASFASSGALPGKIAFISQSGALCTAILDWSLEANVGFSYFVSLGSMIDVGFHDLIDYFGNDQSTSSIVIYMESLSNARKFLSAARAFARTKPIIVLKAGKSLAGAKAAMSHTGSLAGNDAVFDAAFKRAGIIRVDTIGELFNDAQVLSMQKRPKGDRLAIITNAGGPGVIATDHLMQSGGKLAELSSVTIKKLDEILPEHWSHGNPIDILGDAGPDRYKKALEICLADKGIDAILVILTPQAMTDPTAVAKEIVKIERGEKTILASWMGEAQVREGCSVLEKGGIPSYRIPENAIRCFMALQRYVKNLGLLYETPATVPHSFKPNTMNNRQLIEKVHANGRTVFTEDEAKEFLKNYEIPVTRSVVVTSAEKASKTARKLGFPVVMKIVSKDILHKTDVGGVMLDIKSEKDAKKAYRAIIRSVKQKEKGAKISGVLVEKMISKRHELLIGCKKDPIFGPTIVFGMGGIAVEVFKDTNIGLPPLNMALAMRLIEDTKIFQLLNGFRGTGGVDMRSVQFLLYKFAYLVMDFPEIAEIDINPFAIDEKGGVVLDAKVVLDTDVIGKNVKPYSHMVISPYPREYITTFRMKNKKIATLRPIRPEDEPLEAGMFRTFSEQTQRFRFFQLIKDISHEMLIRYTQIDYDREIAIIAEVTEKKEKKMAGVVRLIADHYNETAEFAIVVGDPWHGQGLGNKFTDYILEIAKRRGIKKVFANVLKDNHIMLHMFKKRGFRIICQEDACYAELELQ
ncbi:acetyl CoA synthetase subunit alpha [Candidatus Woesearchaeota archaeon CG11_big_fil_rev_8_21_14_0_20_43_8]|nr:MAG: acetyl CoA synthetase subunit alpha [Candidatus Woesearchaeota archaeon CG11_big_fil_rev_8_21_14_0_20_43_8]PIO04612.1 MAG: acetyl CoA synthetase subunit alpha [Candidatus Woesearchaeota archaeon CG08_land_8_20_14_0_20_43_7]